MAPHLGNTHAVGFGRPRAARNPNLARQIYKIRKKGGYSQEEFARALGVNQATVHRWEANKRNPTPAQIQAMIELVY